MKRPHTIVPSRTTQLSAKLSTMLVACWILAAGGMESHATPLGACPPADHPCSEAGGPGCTDSACCATVCAFDPFCCEVAWDLACVDSASLLCPDNSTHYDRIITPQQIFVAPSGEPGRYRIAVAPGVVNATDMPLDLGMVVQVSINGEEVATLATGSGSSTRGSGGGFQCGGAGGCDSEKCPDLVSPINDPNFVPQPGQCILFYDSITHQLASCECMLLEGAGPGSGFILDGTYSMAPGSVLSAAIFAAPDAAPEVNPENDFAEIVFGGGPVLSLGGGFLHEPLFGSTLTDVDGDIVVTAGPGGGTLGAATLFGAATSGAGTSVIDWPDAVGSALSVEFQNPEDPDPASVLTLLNIGDGMLSLETDLPGPEWETFDVIVLDGVDVVGILSGQSSGSVFIVPMMKPDVPSGACAQWTCKVGSGASSSELSILYEMVAFWKSASTDAPLTGHYEYSAAGFGPFAGDRIMLRPGSQPAKIGPGPTRISITASGVDQLTLRTRDHGPRIAFGDAPTEPVLVEGEVLATRGFMASAVAGSDAFHMWGADDDGDGLAELHIGDTQSGALAEVAMTLGSVSEAGVGSNVEGDDALALVVVSTNNDKDKDRGTTSGGTKKIVKASFSENNENELPFDATVYLAGAVQWAQTGFLSGGPTPYGETTTWPEGYQFSADDLECFEILMPPGTLFNALGDETTYAIDSICLVADGPVDTEPLTTMSVSCTMLEGLVLSSPTSTVVQPPPPCPADLNDDGLIDGADLGLLLGQWGLAGSADLNGDGVVDGADLGLMLGSWGLCV